MKQRLIVLPTMIVLLAFTARAQDKTTFGIRAGVNFQTVTREDIDGDRIEMKGKIGFHIGVNAEIPLASEIYVQPGILFTTKGARYDDFDGRINLYYIEVPIILLYKPELGDGKLLLGIGPYIALGVNGKEKGNGNDIDVKWDKEISYSEYQYPGLTLKRFDAGANLLLGYEFSNNFSAQLNAQLGLVNIHPKVKDVPNDDARFRNIGFGFSVGYRF